METETSCCPPASWGKLPPEAEGSYETKGTVLNLADGKLKAYVVSPSKPSTKGVIVLGDIFGWTSRLHSICDLLAEQSYHVILPDSHRGETKEGNEDVIAWLRKYPYESVVGPDMEACTTYLTSKGVTSTGMLGFCWGAWAFAKAVASGTKISCAVGAHPSLVLESAAFGGSEEAMVEGVKAPVLLLPAGNDPESVQPGGTLAEIFKKQGGRVVPFPNMVHGFVTRGDLKDDGVKKDVEEALSQAWKFFGEHM